MASDQSPEQSPDDQLEEATRQRLSRLVSMPVDTSRLDAALRARIPRDRRSAWRRLVRPVTAVAASLTIVAVIVAAILASSGSEAVASPAQMAQVHRDILAHRIAVTKVDSIDEAGRVLSQSGSDSMPALPQPPEAPPAAHVMACCMKSIQNKNVACVLLQSAGGVPITMSVARSADMRPGGGGSSVKRDDITYHTHAVGSLNMVMTERNGRMVCLMGELPSEQLVDLASKLRF